MKNVTWDDALWGLAALCVDPHGLKGIWLKSYHGPVTQEWLNWLYALREDVVKIPCNIDTERLTGGLDLPRTLQLGRPIKQSGVLAQSNGKLLICPMSERLPQSSASILTQVLDSRVVNTQFGLESESTSFGFIAIDESTPDESSTSISLCEQLGIWIDLTLTHPKQSAEDETLDMLERVEKRLKKDPLSFHQDIKSFNQSEQDIHDLCELAQGFAIPSMRAPWYAARLACVLALLRGSDKVQAEDLGRAARLVLTPRAKGMPNSPEQAAQGEDTESSPSKDDSAPRDPSAGDGQEKPGQSEKEEQLQKEEQKRDNESKQNDEQDQEQQQELNTSDIQQLETSILEAALATLPQGLLKQLAQGKSISSKGSAGRVGDIQKGSQKGRPLPPIKGLPQNGNRLHILATLRHAAPRQKIREITASQGKANKTNNSRLTSLPHPATEAFAQDVKRLRILSEDFHIQRFAKRSESCIIFCIDASGSAALERLAEAKGAVELLLKDSYARRDHICVIGFRDKQAQVHLPATRSLVRAKRELQALPGGGGTPLANAIKLALETSIRARQQGMSPTLVILSDGRANVTLQGEGSRPIAKSQALSFANQWRETQLPSIWLDTSARPDLQAQEVAQAMGANYVPLPLANSQRMASAVKDLRTPNS